MMKQGGFLKLLLITAVFCTSENARATCGTLEVAKGSVKIESAKKITNATVGSKICSGDTIIAEADSRARIKMEDGNDLNVSPNSRIILEKYDYRPDTNKKKVMLNVLYGKVRAATKSDNMYADSSKDGQPNSFQVKTKTAVAGVRGTDFLTSFNPVGNKSEVVTFKGKVEFGQLGPGGNIMNSVNVGPGQRTEVLPGSPPAPPQNIPKTEFDKMNSETKTDPGVGENKNGNKPPGQNPGANENGDKKEASDGNKKPQGSSTAEGEKPSQNGGESKPGDGKGPNPRSGLAGGPSGGGSGLGSNSEGNDKNPGPNPGTPRGPAGFGPTAGGIMLDHSDLSGGAAFSPDIPVLPNGSIPLHDLPFASLPNIPICNFCNDQLQNGPSRVRINILCNGAPCQ